MLKQFLDTCPNTTEHMPFFQQDRATAETAYNLCAVDRMLLWQ